MEGLHKAQSLVLLGLVDQDRHLELLRASSIGSSNRHYFRFMFKSQNSQYLAIPFGLAWAPFLFAKFLSSGI